MASFINPESNNFLMDLAGNLFHFSYEEFVGWDCDTDEYTGLFYSNVPAGSNVIGVTAQILDDYGAPLPLPYIRSLDWAVQAMITAIYSNRIIVYRLTGGTFDAAGWSSTETVRIRAIVYYV